RPHAGPQKRVRSRGVDSKNRIIPQTARASASGRLASRATRRRVHRPNGRRGDFLGSPRGEAATIAPMSDPRFVHLRVHSEFSIADGIVRIDDIVKAAAADGQGALALTDLGNAFGLVRFYQEARGKGI
ncbi:PHP domain-containing protein, partial [Pantoea agglomerans]|uniref:PHP domain-containing protein n=1 Tax=Enterobacter agglomerans TaxID=549 RepID=UPI0018D60C66